MEAVTIIKTKNFSAGERVVVEDKNFMLFGAVYEDRYNPGECFILLDKIPEKFNRRNFSIKLDEEFAQANY